MRSVFLPEQTIKPMPRPPFECVALLLQGGGALGAYQAGVYEAIAEADICPDWVAGISIGAINSAIIVGNKKEDRLEKLRGFWEYITTNPFLTCEPGIENYAFKNDNMRRMMNEFSASMTSMTGVSGFFLPRVMTPWLYPQGTPEATSYYDTADLKETLKRFINFDILNSGKTRFSIGAVNVTSGNFVYFDNATQKIGPEHIMASCALPPAFPAVEIEGEYYWDGGVVSNTPLQWVLDSRPYKDTLAFQVDLWSSIGEMPRNMMEGITREKDIRYSSRTRLNTDNFKYEQTLRDNIGKLLNKLPKELQKIPEVEWLRGETIHKAYNIVHLIYRTRNYEGPAKDYEFSRISANEHWKAGYMDTVRTLEHPDVVEKKNNKEGGVAVFDVNKDGLSVAP